MKIDDVLDMLEDEVTRDRKARWKMEFHDLSLSDDRTYKQNRRFKRRYDDETDEINIDENRRFGKHNRARRY